MLKLLGHCQEKKQFNVSDVALESSNLIEASAGTGKTFSIAILVLRLIVEKQLSLRQILMVTFTKAAVAELESRIRLFIRDSFLYLNGEYPDIDDAIKIILDRAAEKETKQVVLKRIQGAQFQLDETSIFTIHSFCQKTLSEFAFETKQLFGQELVSDMSDLVNKAIQEYWRKEITCLDTDLLSYIYQTGLKIDNLSLVVKKALQGKKFIYNNDLNIEEAHKDIKALEQKLENYKENFVQFFKASAERNIDDIKNGTVKKYAVKNFASVIDDADSFLEALIKELRAKEVKKSLHKAFPDLCAKAEIQVELINQVDNLSKDITYTLYGRAIEVARKYIDRSKHYLNQLSFDDLIVNLHKAVMGEKSDLLKYELQKKYKAVFIDEFQDTDKEQYEIFDTLFGRSSILFYIGDPKQAIYSFRGADIDTYKLAADKVSFAYTMSHNFRSCPDLVEGMNYLYRPVESPFLDSKIAYEAVKAGKSLAPLEKDSVPVKTMAYLECSKKPEVAEQTAYHIYELLTDGTQIEDRTVLPSDIGVLVRKKSDGVEIQKQLQKLKIPSVRIDDTKVLSSEEAELLMYILIACLVPSVSNIHRAILSPLTQVSKADILSEQIDDDIIKLRQVAREWQNKSAYSAISLFMKLYNTKTHLLENNPKGERIITNVLQIAEILHKKEMEEKLSANALLNWFKLAVDGNLSENEAYVQRIDSDEDAVKIVTIHKSKGLAYNIVFAPYLDLEPSQRGDSVEYKNTDGDSCFSFYKTEEELALMQTQVSQENRRLIYVALTRAVYKNYIFHTSRSKSSDLVDFLSDIETNPQYEALELLEKPAKRYQHKKKATSKPALSFHRDITKQWSTLSFSQLSKVHKSFESEPVEYTDDYDDFVFARLAKGSAIGNFIHDIFENIDFTEADHTETILELSQRHSSVFKAEELKNYQLLVDHVLRAKWGEGEKCLSAVQNSKKLPELEFYFSFSDSKADDIRQLFSEVEIENFHIDKGMMYGFVDLFFELDGKYYILDWKSNFLGSSLDAYSEEGVAEGMRSNNYHLQYLIYTVAVYRFLKQKVKDFDYNRHFGGVVYAFVRGMRKQKKSGLVFKKPDYILIKELDKIL
jgi:exodeoxyribonuclease V beta subunit